MKRALFIGRWQPFHNGHKWLIDQKLLTGVPILIAVRDIPSDSNNPFTTEQTMEMIRTVYNKEDVEVISIEDIESVNYGRGVGYEINEFVPPGNIHCISATQIRDNVSKQNDGWKKYVDKSIHHLIVKYL